MTIKINGTNTTAQPSITGTDTDTGLVYGTDEVSIVTGGTERVKIDTNGLKFNGDTAATNALDDYEEGTFNSNIATTGSGSFSSQPLFYTKVGRIVSINGRMQITRTGTATGVLKFQLPFVADNSLSNTGTSWMSHGFCLTHGVSYPSDASGLPFFWEINSTTHAGWFYTRDGAWWTSADPNLISTGSTTYLTFSMVYRAAA